MARPDTINEIMEKAKAYERRKNKRHVENIVDKLDYYVKMVVIANVDHEKLVLLRAARRDLFIALEKALNHDAPDTNSTDEKA